MAGASHSCANWPAPHNHYVAARTATSWSATPASPGWAARRPFEYEMHTIGVDPAYQGQGIGRRMLDELLDFAGRR